MDNHLIDEEKTPDNRNEVLQKDTENTIYGVHRQERSLKEKAKKKEAYTESERDSGNFWQT